MMRKQEKGITMITLVITVVLLIIITGTLAVNSRSSIQMQGITKLQNDIELLNDRIATYYVQYGELPVGRYTEYPVKGEVLANVFDDLSNNDGDTYYTIDLSLLDNITLNYGDGYQSLSENRYIINEKSHIIYYVKGVNYEGKKYHTIGTHPFVGN